MSDDDTHLRFLARSLEPNRWGGSAPLPELDVEGALASVLARAEAAEGLDEPGVGGQLLSLPLESAPSAAPARGAGRWTRALAAALLMVGGLAPWLASQHPETRDSRGSEGVLAVSTAAVVYSEHSGSHSQNG
jgi:hypothetical protein